MPYNLLEMKWIVEAEQEFETRISCVVWNAFQDAINQGLDYLEMRAFVNAALVEECVNDARSD